MDPALFAGIVLALSIGGIVGVYMGRRKREDPYAEQRFVSDEPFIVHRKHTVMLRELVASDVLGDSVAHIEYSVDLPRSFSNITLSDFDSHEMRRSVAPATALPETITPTTSDLHFNGLFFLGAAPSPEVAALLSERRVRKALLDFVDSFPAFCIQNGEVRVIEIGHLPNLPPAKFGDINNWPDAIKINVELIVELVDQLIASSKL